MLLQVDVLWLSIGRDRIPGRPIAIGVALLRLSCRLLTEVTRPSPQSAELHEISYKIIKIIRQFAQSSQMDSEKCFCMFWHSLGGKAVVPTADPQDDPMTIFSV